MTKALLTIAFSIIFVTSTIGAAYFFKSAKTKFKRKINRIR
jgi:uroporphyrinogen-III synthase